MANPIVERSLEKAFRQAGDEVRKVLGSQLAHDEKRTVFYATFRAFHHGAEVDITTVSPEQKHHLVRLVTGQGSNRSRKTPVPRRKGSFYVLLDHLEQYATELGAAWKRESTTPVSTAKGRRKQTGSRERKRVQERKGSRQSSDIKIKHETLPSDHHVPVATGTTHGAAPKDSSVKGGLESTKQNIKVEGKQDANETTASAASSAGAPPVTTPGPSDTQRQHSSGSTKGRLISVKIEHKTGG